MLDRRLERILELIARQLRNMCCSECNVEIGTITNWEKNQLGAARIAESTLKYRSS